LGIGAERVITGKWRWKKYSEMPQILRKALTRAENEGKTEAFIFCIFTAEIEMEIVIVALL
jgi:hypothetical protein